MRLHLRRGYGGLGIIVRILAAIVLLLVAAGGFGYWYLRQSLPEMSGTIALAGPTARIDIVRDADAIPHIVASSKADAFFGLGYVHAQDRLWQMEFQRRIGHGRLSEVFGNATIPQDRFLRTVGFGRAAVSAWNRLPANVKQQVDWYVAGVNAFIDSHRGRRLPPEFSLLRFEPAPFTGPDVVVWVKMMAWDLSANYSAELMRHDIVAKVGVERMNELTPPYPIDGLSIVPSRPGGPHDVEVRLPPSRPQGASASLAGAVGVGGRDSTTSPANLFSTFAASFAGGMPELTNVLLGGGGGTESLGSNNWVVDGTMTASGKPLLANDPHLGTHIPSLWYLAHVSAGEFDMIGATIPGAPAVAIGRNKFIAWGETNVAADVEDLYLEKLNADGTAAEFRGTQEPITIVPETIVVKGGPAVELNVRVTRHGPLVSDAINANNAASATVPKPAVLEALAFRWTALDADDTTIAAFLQLNEARNWTDFTNAMRLFVVPSQNFVYADVDGHIGYFAPGRIPVRAAGDGSRPTPGWTGDTEWTGWIPFDELPQSFDPPNHFIVTANHSPVSPGDPRFIALEFPEPYRAQRITDLLSGSRKLTADLFRNIQADTVSLHARDLLPLLVPRVNQGEDATLKKALAILKRWDFDAMAASSAEAIFQAWFLRLAPALVGDELGPDVLASYAGRFSYITRFVKKVIETPESPWCDDVTTPARESCDQTIQKALVDALADLTTRMGNGSVANWRWDTVHRAVFPHQGLDSVAVLRPLLSRWLPHGGDWSTVNVGPVAADSPFEQKSVPGYRQIVDLSPANDSRFLVDVGESGHFLSPHYTDFLPDWQAVTHKKMRTAPADYESGALGRLTLTPQ